MNRYQRKRTPEDLLAAIEADDADDEAERILALSDEALDADLAEAGFDPKAVRRRGEEIARRAMPADEVRAPAGAGAWVAPVRIAPQRASGARWVALIAAALGVAAAVAVAAFPAILAKHDDLTARIDAEASAAIPAQLSARQVRDRALRACDEQRWQECVGDLDAARTLDPQGDRSERVQAARRAAADATRPRRPAFPDTK